jgi:cysteine desulfuration protein SufE
MTIHENEAAILDEFYSLDDWMDRYDYLIELGKSLPLIDEQFKTDQYVITGCQSKVWLRAVFQDGKVFYTADSDAVITRGIVALLIRVLSGQPPDEILKAELEFIDQIGLRDHLSPTRSNGLNSMIKQMKLYAKVFKLKAPPA